MLFLNNSDTHSTHKVHTSFGSLTLSTGSSRLSIRVVFLHLPSTGWVRETTTAKAIKFI